MKLADAASAVEAKPPPEAHSRHVKSVDGLRAVACLMVVSFHAFIWGSRYNWPVIPLQFGTFLWSDVVSRGYIGVDLFFVISGFCLSYPFFQGKSTPSWREFAKRRVCRIVPSYWIVFVPVGLAFGFIYRPAPVRHWIYGLFFIGTVFIGSFWSLCVEARWYAVFPIVMAFARKYGVWTLALAAFLAGAVYAGLITTVLSDYPRVQYFMGRLPLYLPTLCLGVVAGQLHAWYGPTVRPFWLRPALLWLFLAAAVVTLVCWPPKPSGGTPLELFGRRTSVGLAAFALTLTALFDPGMSKLLSLAPLQAIGLASYSIYLIHEPIIQSFQGLAKGGKFGPAGLFLIFQIGLASLSVAVGLLFHRWVENPSIRQARRWIDREIERRRSRAA